MADQLLQRAMDSMDNLVSDTSVSLERTLERLEELRDEIFIRIEAIEFDIEQAARA